MSGERSGIVHGRLYRCATCTCSAVAGNPATTRILGLCPLLAVTSTLVNALMLALLFTVVAFGCAATTCALRSCVSWRLKPIYHALIAAFVTTAAIAAIGIVDYRAVSALGIYPALIAANCYVLSAIQEVAERRTLRTTLSTIARDTGGITGFLVVLGATRELLAYGTVSFTLSATAATPGGPLPVFASAPGALLLLAVVLAASAAVRGRRPLATPGTPVVESAGNA